jgi:hypothetical protein
MAEQGPTAPTPPPATDAPAATVPQRQHLWLVRGLITLAALLLVLSALAIWTARTALDTSTWTDTSGQMLENPTIRSALSTYLVDQLYANVNVADQLQKYLPPQVKGLAAPAAAGLREYAYQGANRVLATPAVQSAWRNANRVAQQELIQVLDGHTNRLTTTNGDVVLDLSPLVQQVAGRVGVSASLSPNAGRIVLLHSNQLKTAQSGVSVLRVVAYWLWIVALAILGLAVYLARGWRRRALMISGFAIIITGILLVVVRRILGDQLIDRLVTADSIRPAAHQAWWIATGALGDLNTTVLAVGLLTVLGAWFAGPGKRRVAARRFIAPYLADPWIAFGGLAAILLLLIIWGPTNATRSLTPILIFTVLAAVGVEALRRQAKRDFPNVSRADSAAAIRGHWDQLRGSRESHHHAEQPAGDRLAQLDRLADLHARGVITADEFAAKKAEILAST